METSTLIIKLSGIMSENEKEAMQGFFCKILGICNILEIGPDHFICPDCNVSSKYDLHSEKKFLNRKLREDFPKMEICIESIEIFRSEGAKCK